MNEITTKAVLVKLSISQFSPKRQDAKTTQEVLVERNATDRAGVWVKNLIDPKKLNDITLVASNTRIMHYELSLPWTDEGWRILPITIYPVYHDTMRKMKQEFLSEVDSFLIQYPQYIEDAKLALTGMFNIREYPSTEQIKRKFGFGVDFSPLPCAEDFRISLGTQDLADMQTEVEQRVTLATNQAMKELWSRLATPVQHMLNKLKDTEAIFRDSILENIKQIVELIPLLNITGDVELLKIAQECEQQLTSYNPDILRTNKTVRQEAAQQAEELLKRMQGYL